MLQSGEGAYTCIIRFMCISFYIVPFLMSNSFGTSFIVFLLSSSKKAIKPIYLITPWLQSSTKIVEKRKDRMKDLSIEIGPILLILL